MSTIQGQASNNLSGMTSGTGLMLSPPHPGTQWCAVAKASSNRPFRDDREVSFCAYLSVYISVVFLWYYDVLLT